MLAAEAAGWAEVARSVGTAHGPHVVKEEKLWQAYRARQYVAAVGGRRPEPLSPDDATIPRAVRSRVRMVEDSDGILAPMEDAPPTATSSLSL